jgi:hypothetical protein
MAQLIRPIAGEPIVDPDVSYDPVPASRTVHVKTRYVFDGKGKPPPAAGTEAERERD